MRIARVSYGGGISFGVIEGDDIAEIDGPPVGELRFTGKRASLTTHEPKDGRRNFEGELLGRDATGRAGLRTEDGNEHWFEWTAVRSAHLVVDPWERLKRAPRPEPRRGRAPGGPELRPQRGEL